MGTVWVLLLLGALGLGIAAFERWGMRSPEAEGLTGFGLFEGILEIVLAKFFGI